MLHVSARQLASHVPCIAGHTEHADEDHLQGTCMLHIGLANTVSCHSACKTSAYMLAYIIDQPGLRVPGAERSGRVCSEPLFLSHIFSARFCRDLCFQLYIKCCTPLS